MPFYVVFQSEEKDDSISRSQSTDEFSNKERAIDFVKTRINKFNEDISDFSIIEGAEIEFSLDSDD